MNYVALLRGINVGGKNLIKMEALRSCFEAGGYGNVSTYIQSGNVLFDAPKGGRARLTEEIEDAVHAAFGTRVFVVVRSHQQLAKIVADAPRGFGADPGKYRDDVIFLKEPLTAAAAMKDVSVKDGVDRAWPGKGVIYFSRLESRASSSRLSRVVMMPVYQRMTIRNWNTTTKLLALLDAR